MIDDLSNGNFHFLSRIDIHVHTKAEMMNMNDNPKT